MSAIARASLVLAVSVVPPILVVTSASAPSVLRERVLTMMKEVGHLPKVVESLGEKAFANLENLLGEKGPDVLLRKLHFLKKISQDLLADVIEVTEVLKEVGYTDEEIQRCFGKDRLELYARLLRAHGRPAFLEHAQNFVKLYEAVARVVAHKVNSSARVSVLYERACQAPGDPACKIAKWSFKFLPTISSGFEAQVNFAMRIIELSYSVFEKIMHERSIEEASDAAFTDAIFELMNATRYVGFRDLEQEARAEGARIARMSSADRKARIIVVSHDLAKRAEVIEHGAALEHSMFIKAGIAEGQFKPSMDIFGRRPLSFDEWWKDEEHTSHPNYWRRVYRATIKAEIARILRAPPPASEGAVASAAIATPSSINSAPAASTESEWKAREVATAAAAAVATS